MNSDFCPGIFLQDNTDNFPLLPSPGHTRTVPLVPPFPSAKRPVRAEGRGVGAARPPLFPGAERMLFGSRKNVSAPADHPLSALIIVIIFRKYILYLCIIESCRIGRVHSFQKRKYHIKSQITSSAGGISRGMRGWGHPLLHPGAARKLFGSRKNVSAPAE